MANKTTLNDEQLKAVKHEGNPLLIIAGAGTGKTTVITERIKYLILKKNFLPSQILALTFTEKAAREMEERVDVAMPYGYTQMWISTFHSFCDRILRNEAIHIGLNPSYKLMTEAESVLFLRKNLFKFELDYFRPLGNPNKFLSGILQHFSRLKDEDVSVSDYLNWAKRQKGEIDEIKKVKELSSSYKVYEELKAKEGVMDFSDLISNILKLFRERKSVLRIYQEQFKHILVDEFQDTNFAQNELAIMLAGENKNITVVGDDDQSIYRFRGSSVSNIIQFKNHFPDAKIITLTKNYRSSKEILNKSYNFIQNNNPDRLEVKEKISKKLSSMRNIKGEKIEFIFANRVEDEAEKVTEKITELTSQGQNYRDIAILVRANDHSQPFTRAFQRHNIPYQFLGPGRLFHQEEVKDLIAYLKVLYNFEDSASLYRVLCMQIFNFSPEEIASILNFSRKKNMSVFEAISQIDEIPLDLEAKEKIKNLKRMISSHLKKVPKETAGQILFYFMEDSGLLKSYLLAKSDTEEKKAQNISKFFNKLKTYEVEHEDASVFAVVDWIDLSMQMGESPLASDTDWTENNAVNILTIHSSKGLEFPSVFLVNLVSQRFPTRERKEQLPIPQELIKEILPEGDFHLEEERRLFYVGMTRARDNLFLTAANFYGEGKREKKISPFVFETLGRDIVDKITITKSKNIDQLNLLEWSTPEKTFSIPKAAPYFPTYLSYSQIQTFDICPLHYKLRYILKVPASQTSAQSFGTSVHGSLRDFFIKAKTEKLKKDDILPILEKTWINEGYLSKAHEKAAFLNAKKMLLKYLDENFSLANLPLNLEMPFQFFLKNGKQSIKVGGRVDRIDKLENGKIEIIDYKTGGNIPDEKKLAKDLQLTFYALAATEVNGENLNKKPEDVLLSLHYLEKGIKLTTTRTKEQLEEAKALILEKAEEISKSDFACSSSSFCINCEYKILCNS